LAGYVHNFAHSRLAIGTQQTFATNPYGGTRVQGDQGAFNTNSAGLAIGSLYGRSANRQKGRLPGDAQAHNGAVLAYFQGAGLPADQVSGVNAMPHLLGDSLAKTRTLLYYYSVVSRAYGAIPIADSFAWARLNADGEVVSESVYWPEIPQSTLDEAMALQAVMNDVAQRAAFWSKLPPEVDRGRPGHVVIRHASGVSRSPFYARAVVDCFIGNRTAHYDATGTSLQFADEGPEPDTTPIETPAIPSLGVPSSDAGAQ
jgi:hypothetical protein